MERFYGNCRIILLIFMMTCICTANVCLKVFILMFFMTLDMFLTGKSTQSGSFKRSLLRPTSPKSPVASASAFESVEESDDEDNMTDKDKLDTSYLHTNGNVVRV